MKKKLIFFSIVICFGISCKKDSGKNCNLDVVSVSGSYKVTAIRYKASSAGAETDYYNQFYPDACERDDIFIFNTNGTATYSDAGLKCTPPGDDVSTWSLSGNTITIDGGAANVESFNCTTLTISQSNMYAAGDKMVFVFTRQ